MSKFLRHQPCPECGSKDNCAVYDDGHEWCFGCGYYKGSIPWKKIIKKNKQTQQELTLPLDTSYVLPEKAKNWYRMYKITDVEVYLNNFRWSEEKQWLIMPVYNKDQQLVLFQCKTFGTGPKYFTKGSLNMVDHILGDKSSKTLFVVEDMLSAIKISRVCTSMPIFGSNISDEKLLRLSQNYDTLVVWLDYDKTREALKLRLRAKNVFKQAFLASKIYDPKCLNMEMIEHITKEFK